MRDATLRLFDEFAASFARGRDPDLREFLERAGDDAPALAQLVDTFLAGSEAPPASEERTELMRAWVRGEPPILELRKSRKLKRSEVVSRLIHALEREAVNLTNTAAQVLGPHPGDLRLLQSIDLSKEQSQRSRVACPEIVSPGSRRNRF